VEKCEVKISYILFFQPCNFRHGLQGILKASPI
jgi:hypothetical protein